MHRGDRDASLATVDETDVRIASATRDTLLQRARAGCLIALIVVPFTILCYDAAYAREHLRAAVALSVGADLAIALLHLGIRRHAFDSVPSLPFAILAGVMCNAVEAINLALTGGPIESAFLFPYYLVFFGTATLYPASLVSVSVTALLLPLGYVVLALAGGTPLGDSRYVSNLLLLVDYAGMTCIANRVVTAIFVRELRSRVSLEDANARLRELDRVKNELFANVSHELRSPLTMILAPTSSLTRGEAGPLAAPQRALVETIDRNASRLLGLINDLLLLARLDVGKLPRKRERVDLASLARSVATSMEPYMRSLGLALEVSAEPSLPPWFGDARHAERILINLLTNAAKFSHPGGLVRVMVLRTDGNLELSVTDQGIGIAREHLRGVFDRFVQVESASNRRFAGTGIGLSIVKELTELYGGDVSVDSELGRGATFRVRLPLGIGPEVPETVAARDAEAPALERERDEIRPSLPEPVRPVRRPRIPDDPAASRVMVVEDNADLLDFLVGELEGRYRVEPYDDSAVALAHAVARPPDLILSDVMMPRLDGIALAARLRAAPSTRDVPIVLLSARDDLGSKVAGFDAGVNDYLQKPFQSPELHARIDAHLRLRARTRELEQRTRELGDALDHLRQAEATLVQHEKMASLGRVVAGVAHEINNPLHFVAGNVALLKRRIDERAPELRERLAPLFADVERSFERIAAVTHGLLEVGRPQGAADKDFSLDEVTDLALSLLAPQAPAGVHLVSDVHREDRVHANPQAVFQILFNLLHNAMQALPGRGEVHVETARTDGTVELRVVDDGCGIPPEHLGRVLEPFFTTKPPGEGNGLGLAIVQQLVVAQHGQLAIDSQVGHGTTVRVRLPRASA